MRQAERAPRPGACDHPGDDVVADINQGDAVWGHDHTRYAVQWCRICGAYRHVITEGRFTEWRAPSQRRGVWA